MYSNLKEFILSLVKLNIRNIFTKKILQVINTFDDYFQIVPYWVYNTTSQRGF